MLPKTKQATQTEVEGETTVELSGTMADGKPLEEAAQEDQEEQTATPMAEEAKPEEPRETEEPEGEVETRVSEETTVPRKDRRTEKLIDTLKARTDEVSGLRKQLESLREQPVPPEQNANLPPWFQPEVPQGQEIPLEQYRANVAETARNLVKAELTEFQRKSLQLSDYEKDLAKVEAKYDILNPESDAFDKSKAKTVAEVYEKASKTDPSLRLADFVDDLMSFHQAGHQQGQEELKASVIKRDAQTAVTPTPDTGELPGKGPEWNSMTLKEKEAWMKEQGIWD